MAAVMQSARTSRTGGRIDGTHTHTHTRRSIQSNPIEFANAKPQKTTIDTSSWPSSHWSSASYLFSGETERDSFECLQLPVCDWVSFVCAINWAPFKRFCRRFCLKLSSGPLRWINCCPMAIDCNKSMALPQWDWMMCVEPTHYWLNTILWIGLTQYRRCSLEISRGTTSSFVSNDLKCKMLVSSLSSPLLASTCPLGSY